MKFKKNNKNNIDETINYYSEVEPAIFELMVMRWANNITIQDVEELKEIMDNVEKNKWYRVKKRTIQEMEEQKA